MSSTINEKLYNDLHRKNQANKQVQTSQNQDGTVLRRAEVGDSQERSVNSPPRPVSEFFPLFQKVLDIADEQDGTKYNLKVTEGYPTDPNIKTEFPLVTFRVLSKSPADRELKPRLLRVVPDPDFPSDTLSIFQRSYDCRIEMVLWTRTNKDANVLIEWIEDKFFEYLWYFEWIGGYKHVIYTGRGEDDTDMVNDQSLHKRTLKFSLKTSKITKKREAQIKKIKLELNVNKPDSNDLIDRS